MPHKPGDRVTNIEPIGTQVPTGTAGTVVWAYEEPIPAYSVRFDNHNGAMIAYPHEIQDQP